MSQRGRVSAAARSAVATTATLERMVRPDPPKDLDEDEAKIWRSIVDAMPHDWFTSETFGLLEQYCRHIAGLTFIDRVLRAIQKAPKPDLVEWRKMSNVRRLESKTIAMLATKMRLAQQSSYDTTAVKVAKTKAKAKTKLAKIAASKMPWQ